MYHTSEAEQKNKRKGMTVSFICNALLLLIFIIYKLPETNQDELEDKPPYAVKLDFDFRESSLSKLAFDDAGASRAKAESAPQAQETQQQEQQEQPKEEVVKPEEIEVTKPTEIPVVKPTIKIPDPAPRPTPTEPIETKTPAEEAPIKVTTPTRTAPVPEVSKPTPTPSPAPTKPTTSPSTSTSGSGSTSGTASTKSSTTTGEGSGKGSSGTGSGSTKGNDGDEGRANTSSGTGVYDGSGNGIFGRKVILRNEAALKAAMGSSGVIAMKMCINRAGIVTFTEVIPEETTIRDRNELRTYLKVLKTYKFQPDPKAPEEECGKYKFKANNTINNKLR